MPVERVDYSSDEEFRQAQQWEQEENNQQEPDVAPCYFCGCKMYQESSYPVNNICEICKKKIEDVLIYRVEQEQIKYEESIKQDNLKKAKDKWEKFQEKSKEKISFDELPF